MLWKIFIIACLATLTVAAELASPQTEALVAPPETASPLSFETSHKRPEADDDFQTSHKRVPHMISLIDGETDLGMNFLSTKERPELNPVLSALINEDVMKSIEAKRAIEEEELKAIKAELEAAKQHERHAQQETEAAPVFVLTTPATIVKKADLDDDDDLNEAFVDQSINLDGSGSSHKQKSRIEVKKAPNGKEYEYEYVYYYEDEEDENAKSKPAVVEETEKEVRGKSRYSNIERNSGATPVDNTLVSGKAKGRSSSAESEIEPERLPAATRFPSRAKNVDADSMENAAEKRKISVKRPSLELVDSQTFNTDEKQAKGSRGDNESNKPLLEQERDAAAAAAAAADEKKSLSETASDAVVEAITVRSEVADEDAEQTTPAMEKAALDLYAILANENFNMDMTTVSDVDATTILPNADEEGSITTLTDELLSSSTTSTTTTTTTTTEAPTTTTSTTPASLYGKRGGLSGAGRNRFKLKQAADRSTSTTSTEAPPSEAPKTGRNRFSRPPIGGRRPSYKTTAAPTANTEEHGEEVVVAKEVKPISSTFGRSRPRNRFNLRASSTTEKSEEGGDENAAPASAAEGSASTTVRSIVRSRPTLNLRGRSRITTTKAPASEDEAANNDTAATDEDKPAAASTPVRPSRFNLNRAAGSRLPARGKYGRTTEAPATSEDSAAEGSHHSDVKGEAAAEHQGEGEKTDADGAAPSSNLGGLNRLKNRPRINTVHKTEKPKASPVVAPRKLNPLLAKKRLQLGSSTTESAATDDDNSSPAASGEVKDDSADAEGADKDESGEDTETTTKQARGLGLLGQRRRLPLRKPGTIL